jgi:peptidoglycan/xylan/chitin deacetylase (PgdA/CDA1 family)
MSDCGKFVISLDFELMWGVRDKRTIESYGNHILAVHQVIPRLLNLFSEYSINATFSTVGLLFFESKDELLNNLPTRFPDYQNKNLSPYNGYFDSIGLNSKSDKYHFAPKLIELIINQSNHEIGTHTFSHYYCLEKGQNVSDFKADIEAALEIAKKNKLTLTSLIFPRNQFNSDYLKVCKDMGIICFRGNEESWLYAAKNREDENLIRRALRLIDTYINISGHHTYTDQFLSEDILVNIPSSRFLRPYSKKLSFLDALRLNRIKNSMTFAAKNKQTFHLWWHPHNFGKNQDENFIFLRKILDHYKKLNSEFNFKSVTMSNLANEIIHGK